MKKIKKFIKDISLRDKCIIFFMMILIVNSAYSLFIPVHGKYTSAIDVLERAAMASIFGYLLGNNFQIKKSSRKKQEINDLSKENSEGEKVQEDSEHKYENEETNNVQVIIATIIGILSLLILMIAREFTQLPDDALATISQFKTFVSGCIGFLIGVPKNK